MHHTPHTRAVQACVGVKATVLLYYCTVFIIRAIDLLVTVEGESGGVVCSL